MSNPILLDIPEQFETKRLYMRLARPGDGPLYHQAVAESIERLRLWHWSIQTVPTPEEAEAFVRQAAVNSLTREAFLWFGFRKSDDQFAVRLTIHSFDWDVPRCEIGYWLRTGMTEQGYMTEAVNAMTQFIFQHMAMQRVELACDARNHRSIAVAERCGYIREAYLKRHAVDPTEQHIVDYVIFSRIPEDNQ